MRRIRIRVKNGGSFLPGERLEIWGFHVPASYPGEREWILTRDKWIKKRGENSRFIYLYLRKVYLLRERIKKSLNYLPPPYNHITRGILLGGREVPSSLKEIFRKKGLLHILAVSGLHIGIISGVVYIFLKIFPFDPRIPPLITLFFLFIYLSLVGFPPSAVRAGSIVAMFLLGRLICRKADPYNILSLVALLLLLYNPAYLYSPGFQLTFLITFFLFYLVPWMERKIRVPYLGKILSFNIVANLVSQPLIAYHFLSFSLDSLWWTLYLFPFLPLIMVGSIIQFLFSFLPTGIFHKWTAFYHLFLKLVFYPVLNVDFTTFYSPFYLNPSFLLILYSLYLFLPPLGRKSLLFSPLLSLAFIPYPMEDILSLKSSSRYYLLTFTKDKKQYLYISLKKRIKDRDLREMIRNIAYKKYDTVILARENPDLINILPRLRRLIYEKKIITPQDFGNKEKEETGVKLRRGKTSISLEAGLHPSLSVYATPSYVVLRQRDFSFTFSWRRRKRGYLNWRLQEEKSIAIKRTGNGYILLNEKNKFFIPELFQ